MADRYVIRRTKNRRYVLQDTKTGETWYFTSDTAAARRKVELETANKAREITR